MAKGSRGGRRSRGRGVATGTFFTPTRRGDVQGSSSDITSYARLAGSSGGGQATSRIPRSNNGTSRRGGSSADNGGRIR